MAAWLLCGATFLGCEQKRRGRTLATSAGDSGIYLRSVAETLNDLPANLDLNLLPAQPILTASNSADGRDVRAICVASPEVPDGPANYLVCPAGNAQFAAMDVRPGDIVRYYVNLDEESAELEIERRTALELRVRRLSTQDPQNALVIEGGLNRAMPEPQRLEIWRFSDKRTEAIRSALDRYEKLRQPPIGWEPTPDLGALNQIVERANQWLRNQPPAPKEWQPTPLVLELPSELRLAKGVAAAIDLENLRGKLFAPWEGRELEQQVWLRDLAQWARGGASRDDEVARALFHWTVRNVQLDRDDDSLGVFRPWQALAYGHGGPALRAWTFAELCRHQQIPACIVRAEVDGDPREAPLWVAVVLESGTLLLDPRLGIEVPVDGEGPFHADLPTALAAAKGWEVEGVPVYPALAERELSQVTAELPASPLQISYRSKALEDELQGEEFVRLFADVDAMAAKWKSIEGVSSVRLWSYPFERLAAEQVVRQTQSVDQRARIVAQFAPFGEIPVLWKARLLHFQGNKEIRAAERDDPLAEPRRGHADAIPLYQHETVRPGAARLAKMEPAKRIVHETAKENASYWLGLLSYDRGNFEVAADWLGLRTLEASPRGRWAEGARDNLSRVYQAQGQFADAIELLEQTPSDSPYADGARLRIAELRKLRTREASRRDEPSTSSAAATSTPE